DFLARQAEHVADLFVLEALDEQVGRLHALPPSDGDRYAIQTDLMLTNSRMPYSESSRPYPERLMPPKGRRGSDFTTPFTNTEPASICAAMRSARPRSSVQSEAPRPNVESLARRTASVSSFARMTAATGPKVSSSKAGMPFSTAASSVGG